MLNGKRTLEKTDIVEYTNNLERAKAELAKVERDVSSTNSVYSQRYNLLKKNLERQINALLTTTNEYSKSTITQNIEQAKDNIDLFKLELANKSESTKRQMGQLFQKEIKVEAAQNALEFLPKINEKKQRATLDTNIEAVLKTNMWLQDVPFNYSEEIAKFISEGIKDSTMFTFTLNDDKTKEVEDKRTKAMERTMEAAREEAAREEAAREEAARAEEQAVALVAASNTTAVNAAESNTEAGTARATSPKPAVVGGGEGVGGALGAARTIRGKRITRRHKKRAGTRRYKKRAGTRRHKKRSGTHRKRKNTTR